MVTGFKILDFRDIIVAIVVKIDSSSAALCLIAGVETLGYVDLVPGDLLDDIARAIIGPYELKSIGGWGSRHCREA